MENKICPPDALEALQQDAQVCAVMLSGVGEQTFASGADITEFDRHRANAEQRQRYSARGHRWLAQFDKPLLAMVRGQFSEMRGSHCMQPATKADISRRWPYPCALPPPLHR